MTNEQLRMQMLSGIITEGQYKAKLQENAEKASLNESMIGGIVGIGAINQIPPRAKADYEMAFEHFLGERYETKFENREQDPYTMKEGEGEVMVDSNMLKSYFNELISLADDMEYTPEMADELENLKNTIQGGKISVENALDLMQQTIDITGDEIGAVEALGQAVDFDSAIIDKAREISGLDEGKEMKEEEVNEGVFSDSQIQILKGQLKSELNEKLSQYIDGENLETLSNDLTEYVLNGMVEIANAASAR